MPHRPPSNCLTCNTPIEGSAYYCLSCLSSLSTVEYRCEKCGASFLLKETRKLELEIDSVLCDVCYYNKYILPYSYKPVPMFLREEDECCPLFYGIELEIEAIKDQTIRSIALVAQAFPSFIYCKKDSSILYGFEIVIHPASFRWWKNNKDLVEERILYVRKIGYRSFDTNTCGIHIHMDKNRFNPTDIQKLHDFFRYNPGFVLMVSQREQKHLERWAGIYNPGDAKVYFKSINKLGSVERHVAINMNPEKTIEIRIFRGTLNIKSFYKNIEFCDALSLFIKEVEIGECTLENFLKFVIFHKEKYDNLFDFLKDRSMFVGD